MAAGNGVVTRHAEVSTIEKGAYMDTRNERAPVRNGNDGWLRRISWGAILAGAFVALGVQITLSLLGVAIGLAILDPMQGGGAGGVSAGTGIWMIISGIIALFCGGLVAGRLSGEPGPLDRAINGLTLWGVVIAVSLWLTAATASAIVGGALGIVRTSAMAVAQAAGAAAPAVGQALGGQQQALSQIQSQIQQIVNTAADTTPEARQQLRESLQQVADELGNQGQLSQQTREELSQILVGYADMSETQADSTIQAWEQAYQRAASQVQQQAEPLRQTAQEAAQQAADAAAAAAGWTFVVLLLSAVAAAIGGLVATPRTSR